MTSAMGGLRSIESNFRRRMQASNCEGERGGEGERGVGLDGRGNARTTPAAITSAITCYREQVAKADASFPRGIWLNSVWEMGGRWEEDVVQGT
jgi:hypothetical protein